MRVPFLDLHAQYKSIKPEIDKTIQKVLDSQRFILGSELEAFEKEFAKYLGVKYVVGVGSGTDALILSLIALGLGRGDEVITPVNSFIATTTAIIQVGATPIFVDCDKDTYQIDVNQLEKKITKKTKAILPVHLYGAPFDVEEIQEIAKKNNILLVEDAAQAHGATFKGKKAGSFGDLAALSFYPSKNLGAYGDGGAVSTNSEELYKKLLKLRNYGQVSKYYHETYGINSRLDEIQAVILRIKLKHLDNWNERRNEVAKKYREEIKGYKFQEMVPGGKSSYHIFSIESQKRDQLQEYLLKNGIHSLIHYPVPIHLQEVYKYLGYKKGDFPNAERISTSILSIPMYPELTNKQINYLAQKLNFFNGKS
jgi:dTDP-4-amino-4,6-dideoxygalactose transaminase